MKSITDENTIVFLQPVYGHPRYIKRQIELKKLGYNCKILAFTRDQLQYCTKSQSFIKLGFIRHGHYWSRVRTLIKSSVVIRKYIFNSNIVYAYGLDMLLILKVITYGKMKHLKVVYEVGDIRSILFERSFRGFLLRNLEKILINDIKLLVVTSERYIKDYYIKKLNATKIKYIEIENKLPSQFIGTKALKEENKNTVTIGYYGILRCARSWDIMKRLAEQNNSVYRIYTRGIVRRIPSYFSDIDTIDAVKYGGEYDFHTDLDYIYNKADLIWAAVPFNELGWQWRRVNRFYEACFYARPIIAQKGSQDGSIVEKYDIGITIDLANIDESIEKICHITKKTINRWEINMTKLPESIYKYTDEHEKLIGLLR